MKNLLLLSLLVFATFFATSKAQALLEGPWMQELLTEKKPEQLTYQEIKAAGDSYWETHDKNAKGSGFKPYMRWLETAKAYIKKDGTLQSNSEFLAALSQTSINGVQTDDSNWMPMGPFSYTNAGSWSAGQGRVNSMTVDPSNPNVYYIGTPGGGTWKSNDAGITWNPLNDFISRVGSSAVAIDPNNSNIIYVGTGDDDAGDAPSVGLLKSTDGGATFNTTGLQFFDAFANISEVYIDPTNSSKIVVSSNRGLYLSFNAGNSFTRSYFGNVKDVKIKPGDSNTMYLSTLSSFHRSTDGGLNWTEISNGLPFSMGRSVIGVSPANTNYVYLLVIDSYIDYSIIVWIDFQNIDIPSKRLRNRLPAEVRIHFIQSGITCINSSLTVGFERRYPVPLFWSLNRTRAANSISTNIQRSSKLRKTVTQI